MSTARLIAHSRMEQLVGTLVEARVSVSSLAIGPRLDNELLGALANHTGGRLIVDKDDSNAKQEGRTLADAAHGLVVWPSALELPETFGKVFPRRCPPLRFDRDMVLVGKLDGEAIRERPSVTCADARGTGRQGGGASLGREGRRSQRRSFVPGQAGQRRRAQRRHRAAGRG